MQEGGIIELENISLPTATYVKLQPQSPEFLDISNPKAVLERALRTFACLTVGDMIVINYNNKRYEMSVLELKPANAVTIIECDMNVSVKLGVYMLVHTRIYCGRCMKSDMQTKVILRNEKFSLRSFINRPMSFRTVV